MSLGFSNISKKYFEIGEKNSIFAFRITIIIYRKHEGYYYQKKRKERDHYASSCGGYCAVHPERVAEEYRYGIEGDVQPDSEGASAKRQDISINLWSDKKTSAYFLG